MKTPNQLQLPLTAFDPRVFDQGTLLGSVRPRFLDPASQAATLAGSDPEAAPEVDLEESPELQAVHGELVVDLDSHVLLDGLPSFELVDACRRAPFQAAPARRDARGTWQYVAPRHRALLRTEPHADVSVVYLDPATASVPPVQHDGARL